MAERLGKLVVVIGLPGSGKSEYIRSLQGFSGVVAQDYRKHALGPKLVNSRHHTSLIDALRKGKDCLIADIEFCDPAGLAELHALIREAIPAVVIECRYFANDPVQCKANVDERARNNPRRDADAEKRKIDDLSPKYRIPLGALEMPVWRLPRPAGAGALR